MKLPRHPLVYEVNAQHLRTLVRRADGEPGTLADVPDTLLDEWQRLGFQAVWIVGVWQRGERSPHLSRTLPDFTAHFAHDLPDWTEADVCGSPYAIQHCRIAADLGGEAALQHLRERLAGRGIGLILDFVVNHTAHDHPWVENNPEYYIQGTEEDLQVHPESYTRVGGHIFAYGRDAYFPGWKDTLQLDLRRHDVQDALRAMLLEVARHSDGVRCDMAMLAIREVFAEIWGGEVDPAPAPYEEFWAWVIDETRQQFPDYVFMAEAYWGREPHLLALGFDYTYRKQFYDSLVSGRIDGLRSALTDRNMAQRSVFFIENHDELRATQAIPHPAARRAAAALVATLPGMRLIHDGQLEGLTRRHNLHLARRADEPTNEEEAAFYHHLFKALRCSAVGTGEWRLLETQPAWQGNHSHWRVQAYLWRRDDNGTLDLVLANLSPVTEEARVMVPESGVCGRRWTLRDRLSDEVYLRSGTEMFQTGLYVRVRPHTVQIFALELAAE